MEFEDGFVGPGGRRSDFALGRVRKDGHVCAVGGPVRANI